MGDIGSGSGSSYPSGLDTQTVVEVNSPDVGKTKARAEVPNDITSCILAIEQTLGVNPQGLGSDVKTFLQTEHNTDGTHSTVTNATLTTPVLASFYQNAGKTRLMTTPDTASDTLCAIAATQTLTNKTLTDPTITGTISGTPVCVLGDGTTATTQATLDNSDKVATTAYTDTAVGAGYDSATVTATGQTVNIDPAGLSVFRVKSTVSGTKNVYLTITGADVGKFLVIQAESGAVGGILNLLFTTGFLSAGAASNDPGGSRTISVLFFYDGTNWFEVMRGVAGVRS